jgi:hypothetical protein
MVAVVVHRHRVHIINPFVMAAPAERHPATMRWCKASISGTGRSRDFHFGRSSEEIPAHGNSLQDAANSLLCRIGNSAIKVLITLPNVMGNQASEA